MAGSASSRSTASGAQSACSWDLHVGDCLAGLAALDAASIGVVITDPPYEAEAHTSQRLVARAGGKLEIEPLAFPPHHRGA